MAGNSGGPWGGGGGSGGGNRGNNGSNGKGGPGGPRRPGGDQQIPEIDEIVRKGQEQLRVLMGGRGGRGGGGGGGGDGFKFTRGTFGIAALLVFALWAFQSFYTVRPEEQSVELFLGDFSSIGGPGLNFAPWPVVTAEVVNVTSERTESIGAARSGGSDTGLMLTTDENIVDIDFEVVWNISDPAEFLFNLRDPEATIRAVSEAAMREVISASQLAPILNRDRGVIADRVQTLIQQTLDSYDSGVNIVRLNLDRADPPAEVIDAFRDVQAAEQERDRLERQADAYANRVLAGARGEAAQLLEEAEGYRAQVVNEAQGEASRFLAVLGEYEQAPDVTRRRLYLETLERVLGDVDLVILDGQQGSGGSGVVPYLPLDQLRRGNGATGTTTTTGSSN
ncbi:FtsH protease activity modulator HflK [Roseibacterium sp. SDUM158017]|uniref:FtsH protease activity modulator HflK n=1 Tax=Roseicyclus salinarum TaxID=3036773 RepID=UPI00241572B8|nr:FtsH protease activity modulator HflK [Roseibacterium sp. SDUM158017]MDG4648565.1 FtsH protease activity modulator HflK [Roseibacterium sp. SDUM158017]